MKKATKIFLIVGLALLLVGAAISGIAVAVTPQLRARLSFSDQMERLEQLERREYSFDTSKVQGLNVQTWSGEVTITPTQGDEVRVVCYDGEFVQHIVELRSDGTLSIRMKEQKNWLWRIANVQWLISQEAPLTVEVPETLTRNLSVNTADADVRVSGLTVKGNMTVDTASGNVRLTDCALQGNLNICTASGDVFVQELGKAARGSVDSASGNLTVKDTDFAGLNLMSVSGDISLIGVRVTDRAVLDSASGNMVLTGLEAKSVNLRSISGDTRLTNVRITDRADFDSASGNVWFTGLDATSLKINNISGDISGVLVGDPSDFTIRTRTISGYTNVPRSAGGPRTLDVDTMSGDIDIDIVPSN